MKMPSIGEAVDLVKESKQRKAVPWETIVEYLESHPDEVFRPKDKEELARKVNWPRKVSTIPGVLVELERLGKIAGVSIRQYRFYGSHRAIELLKSMLPEEVLLTRRELWQRKRAEGLPEEIKRQGE